MSAVSEPFPLLVICDMLGIPRSEFGTLLRCTNVILGAGDAEAVGGRDDVFAAIIEAGVELTGLLTELVEDRREHPRHDLTSALVHTDDGEGWLHAWRNDLGSMTSTAVEEILRMASPVTYKWRTATRDGVLAGHEFSGADELVLSYGAANRDPRVLADPERLDLRRQPNPHVAFGGPGPLFCLGAHLARREMAVLCRQLLTRLPGLEPSAEPELLQSQAIPLVGGIKRLPVRFTPAPRIAVAG